jgi:multidrug resistance efflux pump
VPDLASKISEKEAEVTEARAKLRLAEAGPRKEEIEQQRQKAERAKQWRDLAEQDLNRKRKAMVEEIVRLSEAIRQHTAERDNARENLDASQRLFDRKALALDQLRDWDKKHRVAEALVKQAEAQHRERLTVGLQEPEGELARRDKEWADARSALTLLEIGTRSEEIEAQKAHLKRLEESLAYLHKMSGKVNVQSSIAGVVTTPYLKEKIGSFVKEGDLICEVENTRDLEVEIPLLEQEVGHVQVGCEVELKARALPFETLSAKVHRIAPAAAKPEKTELLPTTQNTLTVYCRLDDSTVNLHSGMTGYARIYCGQYSMGRVLFGRGLRYLRTEVWW